MLYLGVLRFCCWKCRSGHRQLQCTHYDRAKKSLVFNVGQQGRPALDEERRAFKLVAADFDAEANPKCSESKLYKFQCRKNPRFRCCNGEIDIYLDPKKSKVVEIHPPMEIHSGSNGISVDAFQLPRRNGKAKFINPDSSKIKDNKSTQSVETGTVAEKTTHLLNVKLLPPPVSTNPPTTSITSPVSATRGRLTPKTQSAAKRTIEREDTPIPSNSLSLSPSPSSQKRPCTSSKQTQTDPVKELSSPNLPSQNTRSHAFENISNHVPSAPMEPLRTRITRRRSKSQP